MHINMFRKATATDVFARERIPQQFGRVHVSRRGFLPFRISVITIRWWSSQTLADGRGGISSLSFQRTSMTSIRSRSNIRAIGIHMFMPINEINRRRDNGCRRVMTGIGERVEIETSESAAIPSNDITSQKRLIRYDSCTTTHKRECCHTS